MTSHGECLELQADNTEGWCKASWDGLFCWPSSPPNASLRVPCITIFSLHFTSASHESNDAVAFRVCGGDGQWERNGWTNYSQCEMLTVEITPASPSAVACVTLVGSCFSLAALLIAIYIFTFVRSLQCCRIRVHRNLALSLLLHAMLLILLSVAGTWEPAGHWLRSTGWLCRGIVVLRTYSAEASVHWMFVEGLLLHSSVADSAIRRRNTRFLRYHLIGWGVPCACVGIWLLLMCFIWEGRPSHCWEGYGKSPLVWIVTGPMIAALLVNAVFLVNIIRILVTKMRTSVSLEVKQIRKVARATALLFPLLGVTHLFFCVNPGGEWEPVYMLLNAFLQSTQGLFVSILYCFLNSEVQTAVVSAYTRRQSVLSSMGGSRTRRKPLVTTTSITAPPREVETPFTSKA